MKRTPKPRLTASDVSILIEALLVAASRHDSKGKNKRASDMRALGCKLLQMEIK